MGLILAVVHDIVLCGVVVRCSVCLFVVACLMRFVCICILYTRYVVLLHLSEDAE